MDRRVAPLPYRATTVRSSASERNVMSIRRAVPNIASDKPDACRDFYAGLLGFQVAMDMGWIVTFVSPSNPTAQVSVLREDASAPVVPQITVDVADVDAVHAEAVRRGLEIVHPLTDEPWGMRRFFVKDPNGVVLNVASHRADAPTP
jgi:catechol 2,3-dioxygenase-like lactoylglutathione lyase family enzyme